MEFSPAVRETIRGRHPTTSSFKAGLGRLQIVEQSRQVVDFDKVSQSKDRPNANRFYKENGFGTSVVVQFIVGIKDLTTGELWNCTLKNKRRKLVLENGLFVIEVRISPNGLVCFPMTDIKLKQLPNYLANIKCVLPVEEDEPLNYKVNIKFYQNHHGVKRFLDSQKFNVQTHERPHDVYDYQEGRGIVEVERPQLKIQMTGILAEDIGRHIIMKFQNMGDNGLYNQFYEEQRKLLDGLKRLEQQFGKDHFKDLELSVALEESILLFGQHKMDDCLRTAMDVIHQTIEKNVSNGPFLTAKAHYIISAVYRQKGDFDKAQEHMELSTELLECVFVCEETAVNQYNWAALQSEKAARSSLTMEEQEEAEFHFQNCLLHWNTQKQNDTSRCPMRALIRNVNFHLRSSRQRFPDERKPVNEEGILKAQKSINHVEKNLLKSCSKRHKVTFCIAKADCHIRKAMMSNSIYTQEEKENNAKLAKSILKDTLKVAEELELESEIDGMQDRLRKLSLLLDTDYWREENHAVIGRTTRERLEGNEPEENDRRSMVELLNELAQVSLELSDMI